MRGRLSSQRRKEPRPLVGEVAMCQPPPPKDSDGDGVPDDRDRCPNDTPREWETED
jgi:hypothetical protein